MTLRRVRAAALVGLSDADVVTRRANRLDNRPPDDGGRSVARILASNVFTVFNGIVGGSFLLLLVLGAWQDALFGFFVVANTLIGVVQEFRAKRTLARLAVLNAPLALVLRGGDEVSCAVADVVMDDLLVLRPGEQVAADAVLLSSNDLEIDESLLTGEAEPVRVKPGRELLSGSTVAAGSGTARVVRVGAASYAARITAEARQFSLVNSELRRSIGRIIRWLSIGLLPIGAIVINGQIQAAGGWTYAVSSGAWRDAAVASVASIIAMVPAGLVFMTSVALAVGAVRLAGYRVLVRELAAVEGLARVDIVCVDKTGTLTMGAMTLDRVDPVDDPPRGWSKALAALAADPVANATSRAIGERYTRGPTAVPTKTVSFSSRHKWSGASFGAGETPGAWVLGGADIILADSTARSSSGARERAHGRTLVLAHSPHAIPESGDPRKPRLPEGLAPVAVLRFKEHVRSDAADTIRYFAEQGVEVCIISGDDPVTVAAVAHEVGLPSTVTGIDARELPSDPTELAEALRTGRVFGRVTPQQKKAMVLALKSLGHTVAMVGDGVNDTLALKHADLGIAMGSGSPAARSVAHIVLLDGELSRLPGVVAEGRRVIANTERLARLFLSKTVYAILLAVTFGLLLWPFPFLPRQLSVVDGLTIGLPALVLALLPNSRIFERGFLTRAARFCLPSGLIVAAAVTSVVAYAAGTDTSAVQSQSAAVLTLGLCGMWVLVVLARPFTRATAAVAVSGYLGLTFVFTLPISRDFLRLEPPAPELLIAAVGASVGASLLLELVFRSTRRTASPRRS